MTTAAIVSLISILLCLFLVVRNLRGNQMETSQLLKMGLAWAAIIAGLALLLTRFA